MIRFASLTGPTRLALAAMMAITGAALFVHCGGETEPPPAGSCVADTDCTGNQTCQGATPGAFGKCTGAENAAPECKDGICSVPCLVDGDCRSGKCDLGTGKCVAVGDIKAPAPKAPDDISDSELEEITPIVDATAARKAGATEGAEGGAEGGEGTAEGGEGTVEGGEGDGGAEGQEASAEGGESCEPECSGNSCCEGGACVEGECDPASFKPECDPADNTLYKVCEACKFKFKPCDANTKCVEGACIQVGNCKPEQNTCKDKTTASVCNETNGQMEDKSCGAGEECRNNACEKAFVCPATACGGDATMAQGPGCRYCIDKFEASVWDAPCAGVPAAGTQYGAAKDDYPGSFPDTATGGGSAACAAPVTAPLYACSVPGVVPSRFITVCQVDAACAAVGKRLCKLEEWRDACDGVEGTGGENFPYGATYNDSFCATSAVSSRTKPEATQAMSNCKTPSGIYDLVGNAAELVKNVAAGDKIQPAGADYSTNAQKAPTATRCDADVSISLPGTFAGNPIMGFRCCKDEVPGP